MKDEPMLIKVFFVVAIVCWSIGLVGLTLTVATELILRMGS